MTFKQRGCCSKKQTSCSTAWGASKLVRAMARNPHEFCLLVLKKTEEPQKNVKKKKGQEKSKKSMEANRREKMRKKTKKKGCATLGSKERRVFGAQLKAQDFFLSWFHSYPILGFFWGPRKSPKGFLGWSVFLLLLALLGCSAGGPLDANITGPCLGPLGRGTYTRWSHVCGADAWAAAASAHAVWPAVVLAWGAAALLSSSLPLFGVLAAGGWMGGFLFPTRSFQKVRKAGVTRICCPRRNWRWRLICRCSPVSKSDFFDDRFDFDTEAVCRSRNFVQPAAS